MGRLWGKLGAGCAVAALTISLPSLADTYTVPAGQTQTQANPITDGTTANIVTIQGGGTEALTSTTSSYTGGTVVIQNSTVQVSTDTALGGAGYGITLGNNTTGGILDLTPSTAAVFSVRPITLGAGGGTILAGANAWTFSGVISGSGSLTVGGTNGTLILSGANTYTGGTVVTSNENLEIAADTVLGSTSGPLTLGNAQTPATLSLLNTTAVSTTRALFLGAGGATINSGSASWTFTSPITGPGTLNVGGTNVLVLDGVNTYTGGTNINAGLLQVGDPTAPTAQIAGNATVNGGTVNGYGTILGNINNIAGIVAPAGSVSSTGGAVAGNLTVNGNYTQGAAGTLQITVASSGGTTTASQLVVGGAAKLAGALQLNYTGNLLAGSTTLLTAGSVTGAFTTQPALLNVGFGQQLLYTPTSVQLALTQLKTLAENPSIYAAVKSASIDDAQAANDTILGHLTDARTGAAVDKMRMAYTDNHSIGRGYGSSPYGMWAKGLGEFGSTSGNGTSPGYNESGGGFMAGMDTQVSPGVVLGAAIGYSKNSVKESGGGTGNISAPRLTVYGGWWVGPIALDATVGYGYGSVTSTRAISQTGVSAGSSYGGGELTAAVQASTNFEAGPIVITPALGAKYALLKEHSFSENGGGAYNLNGLSSSTNSLQPFISATASSRFDWGVHTVIEPSIKVMYQTEAMKNSRSVSVQPDGDNYTFVVAGLTPSRSQASINAGVTIETSRDLAFFTDVGRLQGGNTTGTKVDAGMRYRF